MSRSEADSVGVVDVVVDSGEGGESWCGESPGYGEYWCPWSEAQVICGGRSRTKRRI